MTFAATSVLSRPWRLSPRATVLAGLLGIALTLLLAIAAPFAPAVLLRGWLVGVVGIAGVALGCAAWLAIHALSGGRWGEVARPALLGGATALPLVVLLAVPVIVLDRWIFPWASDPATAGRGVAAVDLNGWSLALRGVLLLGGMALVGWRARAGVLPPLLAGLALLGYGVLMDLAAFDWLLSLDPHYTSSAIGMQIIVLQLLSALCVVVLFTDAPAEDDVWGDYGSLMLACLLGEAYLLLMTLVVHWYGDLPAQAAWYLARSEGGWQRFEIAATVLGALGPGAALMFGAVRRSPSGVRTAALAALAGVVAELVWLIVPGLGPDALGGSLAGVAATGACGALLLAILGRVATKRVDRGEAMSDAR